MAIDQSSAALLHHILYLTEPETVSAMAERLKQSRRKIYYHLDKINEALPTDVPPLVPRSRVGLQLSPEQKMACQELLEQLDSYSYILNGQERVQLLALYIVVTSERVTIDKLQQLIEVSRNTVLSDLGELRYQLGLDQFALTLTTTKAHGYMLRAQAFAKIQYIYHLLYEIFTEGSSPFLAIIEEKIARKNVLTDFDQVVTQKWSRMESILGKGLNRQDFTTFTQIFPYLLQAYRNMDLGEEEMALLREEFALVHERVEYQAAQELANSLANDKAIHLEDLEIDLITIFLLSSRKDRDDHAGSEDFTDLRATLEHYIWYFQNQSHYIVDKPEVLLEQLTMHCKAMLFRKRYAIFSKNVLLDQIKSKYPELFAYCRATATMLEKAWEISLTDDDIADLSIHIGGSLRTPLDKREKILQIYIVSDEGVAIQKMLLKQIQYHLPNELIQAVFTTEQYRSVEDLLDADLVITTSEGFDTQTSTLQVSPILASRDIDRIQQFVQEQGNLLSKAEIRQQLDRLLSAYIYSEDERKQISYRIEKIFGQRMMLTQSGQVESD